MKLIAVLLCGTLLFSACKKKQVVYVINGTIADNSLNTSLQNASVSLYTFAAGSSSPELYQTVTTGSDGSYTFDLPRSNYSKLEIQVTKPNYFNEKTTVFFDNITNSQANTYNMGLYAYSWVKLHFVSDGSKDLKYIKQIGKDDCAECCDSQEHFLYGNTDHVEYCINDGNTNYQIYYNVLNSAIQGPLSVVTTPFDTTELIISY